MKTKLLMASLLASAALVAPVQAGNGHHNGGSNSASTPSRGNSGGSSVRSMSVSRFGGGTSFRSMPKRNFSDPSIYSVQRFSSQGMRSPGVTQFRSRVVNSNASDSFTGRQFTRGNFTQGDRVQRFSNTGNQLSTNLRRDGNTRFENNQFRNGSNQVRNGNQGLRSDWQKHVFAQHAANSHPDWDRRSDHWWHGHRCHFFNGVWIVFDIGFDPWWWWYSPYDYYGYGYPYPYSYGYDPGDYSSSAYYDDDGGYADQAGGSTVAAVQERLAREGYYRGAIDGVFGPETRAALADYQSNHGLRVTGTLSSETLAALGLRRVATY